MVPSLRLSLAQYPGRHFNRTWGTQLRSPVPLAPHSRSPPETELFHHEAPGQTVWVQGNVPCLAHRLRLSAHTAVSRGRTSLPVTRALFPQVVRRISQPEKQQLWGYAAPHTRPLPSHFSFCSDIKPKTSNQRAAWPGSKTKQFLESSVVKTQCRISVTRGWQWALITDPSLKGPSLLDHVQGGF